MKAIAKDKAKQAKNQLPWLWCLLLSSTRSAPGKLLLMVLWTMMGFSEATFTACHLDEPCAHNSAARARSAECTAGAHARTDIS